VLDAVLEVNAGRPDEMIAILRRHIPSLVDARITVLGLAFKPDTDDLRESPMVRLVEGLIGKGCDVRILDRSVSIARLGGANRRYIEEEIPHIASLMCESLDPILEHAEVLVVGNGGEDARRGLALARPDQAVVDLTRSVGRSR